MGHTVLSTCQSYVTTAEFLYFYKKHIKYRKDTRSLQAEANAEKDKCISKTQKTMEKKDEQKPYNTMSLGAKR